jgi:hypothetical protein
MCMMTVLNICSLCLLKLSIISLNSYNVNLDSNSNEPYDLSLNILFVGNYNSGPNNTDFTAHSLLDLILWNPKMHHARAGYSYIT